jgi:hypothetical protein
MRQILLIPAFLLALPPLCSAGQNAVVLSPSSAQSADLDQVVRDVSSNGNTATVLSVEEADVRQAGLLNDGGPVIVADPGLKGGYKVYDWASGADITKRFNSGLADKEEPAVMSDPEPKQTKTVPLAPKAQPKKTAAFKKNHVGLSAGMSNLRKNEDSFEVLAANNSGAQVTQTRTTGRFRLFYEHYFSGKYGIGLAAGTGLGGQTMYAAGNRTLNIETNPKTATLYFIRRFGRHFSAYLGGGADIYSFEVEDPSNLAGAGPGNYEGNMTAPHGEAGLVLSAGNFSLRFSLKQTLGEGMDELTRNSNGTDYRLIVRNNNTLSYKASGQALASNEKYFQTDLGGFASAVTINYSFANW